MFEPIASTGDNIYSATYYNLAALYFISGSEVSKQYSLECNKELQFKKGTPEICHDYTILTDNVCELMENTTQFEVRLSVTSTDRLDINSSLSRATVSIDDSREPECCKLCCTLLFLETCG